MTTQVGVTTRGARLDSFFRAARPSSKRASRPSRRLAKPERLDQVLASLRPQLDQKRSAVGLVNVWTAARLKREEVRNAAVLAMLLDPAHLGNLSRAFLNALLEDFRLIHPGLAVINVASPYSVTTEVCPLGHRDTRIDLIIEGQDFLVGIEVKIDAPEYQAAWDVTRGLRLGRKSESMVRTDGVRNVGAHQASG